jgi:hypothetical protein
MLMYTTVLAALTAPLVAVGPLPRARHYDRPRVEIWTNRGEDPFARGDRARVYFRSEQDAFVTVFRVDTDGRVRVLFPQEPWEDAFTRAGREYEIAGPGGRPAFSVDDPPGVGYVFAVVAADAFDYRAIVTGDHWDYRVIADGRVRGDPYVSLTELAQRIVPEGYEEWDYDLVPYYVERHYDYPRFVCYDCHAYASWTYWDPYGWDCLRFRIVIYDDPWYYPYRYYAYPYPYYPYGGTRVVFTRPYRPPPRFVFKEWGGDNRGRDPFVTRERQRPVTEPRGTEARGRDVGGIGSIPAPRTRDRQPPRGEDRPDNPERPGRPDRPDDDRRGRPERGTVITPPRQTERDSRPAGERRVVVPGERSSRERSEPRGGESTTRGARGGERRDTPRASSGASGGERERSAPRTSGSSGDRDRSAPRASGGGGDRERSTPRASGGGGGRERSTPRASGGGGSRSSGGGGSKPATRSPELTRRRPS